MSKKSLIMLGMIIGSFIGGYIPIFLGASFLSTWSLVGSFFGGLLGVWITYKLVI